MELKNFRRSEDCIQFQKRQISISSKRQITIPAKYFEALELNKELDCIYSGNMLILTPVRSEDSPFAEEILKDLIDQGYSGDKLMSEVTKMNRNIRPAVEKMIEEADRIAEEAFTNYKDKTGEIFGE
ncbi:MAG: AbrB/MazE/SpoVT family DNA-binding domain-containing protein [Anaerovoracaceae bacterium]|jgi:bifunctional DNA-binding transcriptional regulator/antitoxin component of YhaV-PrlF toxin-antitoxin module|nr:AbrB/MazE/SpoVT family DNA-binding domain-containing protein [Anaerovoracaceae bacterium]